MPIHCATKAPAFKSGNGRVTGDMTDNLRLMNTLEKVRYTLDIAESDWLEILNLSWSEYFFLKCGTRALPSSSLSNLSKFLETSEDSFHSGDINFSELAFAKGVHKKSIPEKYLIAAHGRCRTTMSSIDYLDKKFGWQLKADILNKFDVCEKALSNPFERVSIQLISDICKFLSSRCFSSKDFYEMGSYSFQANQNSVVGKFFSQQSEPVDVYKYFFGECLPFFEQNCIYSINVINALSLIIEARCVSEICHELGVPYLGNQYVCDLKRGLMSSLACYVGWPEAQVIEPTCVHRGDDVCRFQVDLVKPQTYQQKVAEHRH